ncbi:HORMA domain-containing protein [Boletus coccyginus]|nr:HORMA domain-containing protein [Boletus coccyginus]
MQAQATVTNSETQILTNSTSLQCVETLLKAGLGCIAYLRGLLPYENFSEYHLSAQFPSTLSSASFDNQARPTVSGMTIMSLKRGFTNEGDRILDYLEKGIFEAIEKQYLRRFIFAVYLDSKDPNNIVEAYTFNFQYYKVAGTDTVVPIMSLGDQLSKMSLHRLDGDPVVDALKRGNLPTLGDMEALPKCRYGNFKLFFNDNTPEDYQPPYFRAGDADSNRWFFTTHRAAEVPESTKIGNLETGWHGVSMKVVSVSSFLPSSTEDNNATFTGLTTCSPPKLTPVEEARLRVEDAELQRKDALNRNVVWDADTDADEDALGEDILDEGIVLARCNAGGAMVPIGVRGEEGRILPIPVHEEQGKSNNVIEYGGHPDPTPTHVGYLVVSPDIEETQVIPATQEIDMQSPSPLPSLRCVPSLPPSDIHNSSTSFVSTQQIDTFVLHEKLRNRIRPNSNVESQNPVQQNIPDISGRTVKTMRTADAMEDDGHVDCDCGTMVDDCLILCEGGCKKWRHVWCMGYHGTQDRRLPLQFVCFDCRLRRSPEWDFIAGRTHADMISRFKDLALFRRAIKIFEVHRPNTALQFREQIGCAAALVSQLLMRLEDEGFITTENAISEDFGSVRADARKGKKSTKNKGKKAQNELHKTKYVFLHSSKRSKAYLDYFHAEPQVENRLLGLTNGVSTFLRVIHWREPSCISKIVESRLADGNISTPVWNRKAGYRAER